MPSPPPTIDPCRPLAVMTSHSGSIGLLVAGAGVATGIAVLEKRRRRL